MMRLRVVLALAIVGVLAVVLGSSWNRYRAAQIDLAEAKSRLTVTEADVGELLRLRSRQPRIADRPRPETHVLAQVNATLADVGIPARRLRSLQPQADAAVTTDAHTAGDRYRKQSMRITLEALDMPDLGAFLVHWRTAYPVWTPERIELMRHRTREERASLYDATITISAIYLSEE